MAFNGSSLDSFICYYLHVGFSRLYLYLDDPNDASVGVTRRYPTDRVTVRVRDAAFECEWEGLPSWSRLRLYAATEVQARQMLNCEHAIARCREHGDEWLLHVDSDELLYLPGTESGMSGAGRAGGGALQRHLAELERLGAILFTYRNLEAVPEALECVDPYRVVSLFKQHPGQLDEHHPAVAAAMRYWSEAPEAGGELFRFYANGKSIVRVHEAIREACSVHEWNLPSKHVAATAAMTNNRQLRHSHYVYHQLMRHEEAGGAVLLHFAVCSFETFWRKRWAQLGYASPNHRFRGGGSGLEQRANALALGARRAEAEAFYRRSMMIVDEREKRRQLEAGVCIRLGVPELIELARRELLPRSVERADVPSSAAPLEREARAHDDANPSSWREASSWAWLDASAAEALEATVRLVRAAALAAVADDRTMGLLAEQALVEATRLTHAMASEALAMARSATGARALVERLGAVNLPLPVRLPSLPGGTDADGDCDDVSIGGDGGGIGGGGGGIGGDGGGGAGSGGGGQSDGQQQQLSQQLSQQHDGDAHLARWYAHVFEALLPRAARATLQLLPLPRLMFDLAAYWTVPAATAVLRDSHVSELLLRGSVLIPDAFPPSLVAQAAAEARAVVAAGALLPDSTTRVHERSCWLLCPEGTPRTPEPEPIGAPPPSHLYGASHTIASATSPALCAALRGLRGIAAALEAISELRLSTPRGARLRDLGSGGLRPVGPPNSGWPDVGCEVDCTLMLGEPRPGAQPVTVRVESHGVQRTLHAHDGALLLTLSRQASCHVVPVASEALAASRPTWLTMHMYSTMLRSAGDGRMLGISRAAREGMAELRSKGMLHTCVQSGQLKAGK